MSVNIAVYRGVVNRPQRSRRDACSRISRIQTLDAIIEWFRSSQERFGLAPHLRADCGRFPVGAEADRACSLYGPSVVVNTN